MAPHDRRQFLKVAGTAAAGSLVGLAGCSGDGGDGGGDGGGGDGGDGGGGGTTTGDGGGGGGSKEPINVGLLEPFSGPIAASGKEAEMGTKIIVERLNAQNGLGGREINVVTADTEASPDTAVSRARQLIQQDNCEMIIGLVSSAVAKAVNQFTASQGVPLFVTGAATPDIVQKECKKTTFRLNSNLIHQQRATAQMMLQMGGETRIAGVEPDYVYGQQSWDVFTEYYGELVDLNVVSEQFPAFLKGDYSKEIQAVLDAEPNAVHSTLYSGDMVSFIQQAKQYDFFNKIDYFVAGVVPQEVAAALGSDMPDNCYAMWPDYFNYPADNQQLTEFSNTYMERFSEVPTTFSISTAKTWQVIARAAAEAGTKDVDAFVNAVEGYRLQDGIQDITARAADHQGVPQSYMTGKMAPIGSEYAKLYGHDQLYGVTPNESERYPVGKDKFAIGPKNCDMGGSQ